MTILQIIRELDYQLLQVQTQLRQLQHQQANGLAIQAEQESRLQHKIELYATALDALKQI